MPTLSSSHVIAALEQEVAKGGGRSVLLRRAAELIQAAGPPYTSVYLYMLQGDTLVLEQYAGRDTEHQRIRTGDGVCGSAVATGQDQNVGDVREHGNYIACNAFTRSELVVLIRQGELILGQIDVDSDQLDPFTSEEVVEVREIAAALGRWL